MPCPRFHGRDSGLQTRDEPLKRGRALASCPRFQHWSSRITSEAVLTHFELEFGLGVKRWIVALRVSFPMTPKSARSDHHSSRSSPYKQEVSKQQLQYIVRTQVWFSHRLLGLISWLGSLLASSNASASPPLHLLSSHLQSKTTTKCRYPNLSTN